MLNKRGSGVIMHISSIPGKYGVGVFDENCAAFVDALADMGFSYWQVLPFNPIDASNSPYCSASAFAGNILFIDPMQLAADGLCTEADAKECECPSSPYTADYKFASLSRLRLLKKAFSNIDADTAAQVKLFESKNKWLTVFARFMALKEENGFKPWWEWDEEYARYELFKRRHAHDNEERAAFWKFSQYVFFKQWEKIKRYANGKGVEIIGDMPIYVSLDSADVWANRELFLIDDATLRPECVAGVPPDYFSENGQLWGNPLYDWQAMHESGYAWWLDRLSCALRTYDVVRIDHFRAFASFWRVPFGSETAKVGEWEDGPGMRFFSRVFEAFPDLPIIAEDLGVFGEDVVKLLEDTGFPCMRVIQFGFDPGGDSTHIVHNVPKNCVYYVGTHDNNTLLGWLWEADEAQRRFALDYCSFKGGDWGEGGYRSPSCRSIIEALWRSQAQTAMIAFQDLCGFGADARMNVPGVPEKNWLFRTTRETVDGIDREYFKKINRLFRR